MTEQTKRVFFRKSGCALIILSLCLLAGCAQEQEVQEKLPAYTATSAPEPIDVVEEVVADDPVQEPVAVSGVGDGNELLFDWGNGTQISYKLISWEIYDSWETAGVEESDIPLTTGASTELGVFENIPSEPPAGGGILMVDIEVTKLSGEENRGRMDMIALASMEMGEAVGESDETDNFEYVYYLSDGWYFSLGSVPGAEASLDEQEDYWEYELPEDEESMVVTLGYIIGGEIREAAERGELALILNNPQLGIMSGDGDAAYLPLELGE